MTIALEAPSDLMAVLRPRTRGWVHAGLTPVVAIVGLVLVLAADGGSERAAIAVFGGSSLLLFAVSAVYNLKPWEGALGTWLQRLDHANIYVLIAGSYTPFAVLLLSGAASVTMLVLAWSGATIGAVFRLGFPRAPRWATTGSYLALGWVAIAFTPQLLGSGRPAALALLLAGGVLYSVGAVVYARRRPDPWPAWFGFHEVFHCFTAAGFVAHCAGVFLLHGA
ncbi:hemolysin III family protein [Nocardioides humilatus]|uniref:Hemolysin III family protein n=1 Tax=Nocardioides humilatus TaxID=2607660 RepID=A0A5B1LDZ3_9ACTN|nr:hemolysin III family protein [Nocardioides humilatus]KAA1418951.1 hemolysin III family protein [Nocardioides humilatus]